MAIEDHPRYQEWRNALDYLKEAHERYGSALLHKSPHTPANKKDRDDAQRRYDIICEELS